jgi:hypothetical protein
VLDLFQAAEHRLVGEIEKFFAAEIVVAPLHVADAQPAICVRKQRSLQSRDIFKVELLLQILRAGRDDDSFARADHGQQISQRFAGASAGFDDQVALFFEGFFHGLGHLQLAAAKLVGGVRFREHAARSEELVQRESRGPSFRRGHGMG